MAKLDDGTLAAILTRGINQSVGLADSRLSRERTRINGYYEGTLPKQAHAGDSKFVSQDVYVAVETMAAQVLEVVSGNSRPVRFTPARDEPLEAAEFRTDVTSHVIYNQNPGFRLIEGTIKDALKNRNGIVKVWWEDKVADQFYELTDATVDELRAFLTEHPEAEVTESDVSADGTIIDRVRLKVKADRSQVRIKLLPPEQFGISPMAEDILTAELVFHKQPMTLSDMLKQGYDKAKIEKLRDEDRTSADQEPEIIERFADTGDVLGRGSDDSGQRARKVIVVYECYREIDVNGDGTSQLHKIVMAGGTVLSKEPVDRKPFVNYCPLPRQHAFWGTNFAHIVTHIQAARTYLTRSIINHALITNNPRMMVVKGAVLNPRELMENRVGGIVNVTRPDGVIPVPQAGLNPFVFQTIALLEKSGEDATGISSLSRGMNKDAVSKQNSADMIDQLINASETRQRIIARNFVEVFLRDLYAEVYRLLVENEKREKMMAIGGKWTPVNFLEWPEDSSMEVSFHLGSNDGTKESHKYIEFDKVMSSDPGLAPLYPIEKRYLVILKAAEAAGIQNPKTLLLDPSQAQPQQPDPEKLAKVKVLEADAKTKDATTQAILSKIQTDMQNVQTKAKLAEVQDRQVSAAMEIATDKLHHQIVTDAAEISLAEQAQKTGDLKAIASPGGR